MSLCYLLGNNIFKAKEMLSTFVFSNSGKKPSKTIYDMLRIFLIGFGLIQIFRHNFNNISHFNRKSVCQYFVLSNE